MFRSTTTLPPAPAEPTQPQVPATASGLGGLRIALVGPLPPPAGGMAQQTLQLADLLRSEGAQVTLVQTNAPYRPAVVGRVPMLRAAFRLLPYLVAVWRAARAADLVHVMANSGWSWHLFAAPAVWAGRLRGRAVVVNYRGGEAAAFLERSQRSVAFTLGKAALVVPSGFLLEVFGRHGMVARVVPNIIDLARFRPATQSAPAGRLHLVVVRNLEPIYDNATAIRAAALLRPRHEGVRLTLAGTGPEEPALRRLAVDLGVADRVHFAGRLDREAVAGLLRDADVALNPSRVDNMPNSVLEALASGVPVVSTRVGGVPYIVQDGTTALLVPPSEPAAMADAVNRLVDNPALAAGLRRAGLDEVQRYAWKHVRGRLAELYREIIAAAPRRG